MAEHLDRWRAWEQLATRNFQGATWRPPADIYRTSSGWLLKLDLAGVHTEDVEVRVNGSRLIVRGVRRDRIFQEGQTAYSMDYLWPRTTRENQCRFMTIIRPR